MTLFPGAFGALSRGRRELDVMDGGGMDWMEAEGKRVLGSGLLVVGCGLWVVAVKIIARRRAPQFTYWRGRPVRMELDSGASGLRFLLD